MLGDLSARYESNGDPGAISHTDGDAGGASYGAYQFATNEGVPQAFVQWLGDRFNITGEPGNDEFDTSWKAAAEADPDGFLQAQHEYVRQVYFEPAKENLLEVGYDLAKHSEAVSQVVWSAAVQYSPHYIKELFETACQNLGYPNLSYIDAANFDADMIRAVYDVRATDEWTNGSPSLRPGLRNRFSAECEDALAMLGS